MKSERQRQLEAFLAEDPHDPFTHYALALELIKQGDQTAGLSRFEWLVYNHPEYLATFYQLGKLYETMMETGKAIAVYKKGMEVALSKQNKHTFQELKTALEDLTE